MTNEINVKDMGEMIIRVMDRDLEFMVHNPTAILIVRNDGYCPRCSAPQGDLEVMEIAWNEAHDKLVIFAE